MGGLIQLAAYGQSDVFLTGNPQITFWKMVFKRYTNFAIESIEQPFTGNANFGTVSSVSLPKNTADLIHKCHIQLTLKKDGDAELKDKFGLKLLKRVILSIDGMDIDSQTGEWMEYWNQFTMEQEKESGYDEMIGNSQSFTTNSQEEETNTTTVTIPLQLYFCKNPGLSLPIHALQYSEVKIKVEFHERLECTSGDKITIEKCSLFVDYVYLDVAEKKQILQGAQEFLISQQQETSAAISPTAIEGNIRLDFIHPVKELIWCFQDKDSVLKYMTSAYITMNGNQKRASERPAKYYRLSQPYDYHTRIPTSPLYMYSFALKPEDTQPCGTCNFSRLDNAYLYFKMKENHGANKVKVFATNTNLFRIMSGKGALAYS